MKLLFSSKLYSSYKIALDKFDPSLWLATCEFIAICKTREEISVIAESTLPIEAIQREDDWMAFSIEGPIPYNISGVLTSVLSPLSEKGISVLAVSTFDTDYVFYKKEFASQVRGALENKFSIVSFES